MSEHVPSDRLVAFVDGEIQDASEREAIAGHVASCVVCRMDCEALASLEQSCREAGARALEVPTARAAAAEAAESPRSEFEPLNPALDRKLHELAHAALSGASSKTAAEGAETTGRLTRRGLKMVWPVLLTAAATLLVLLLFRTPPEPARLAVTATARVTGGQTRGTEAKLWSLVVSSARAGYVAIFAVGESAALRLVYPDPNPVIAELQKALRLERGVSTRVPTEPSLDFDLGPGERELLVVVSDEPWDRARSADFLRARSGRPLEGRATVQWEEATVALVPSGR